MNDIYIVVAKRTPVGRFGGGLSKVGCVSMCKAVAEAMLTEELTASVDKTILGQVLQAGQGMNVARQVALAIGIPEKSPACTVNMVCGSSLKAVSLGCDAIRLGEADLVLTGGVESMSLAPHYSISERFGKKLGDGVLKDAIITDGLTDPTLGVGMGETAERIADRFSITREEQDAFALLSQQRVGQNREALSREIVAIGDVALDEHPRADTTLEGLQKLPTAFRKDGTVTAGNASGINDGAALVLLASEAAVKRHSLEPVARVIAAAEVGCSPEVMGLGPVEAIRQTSAKAVWTLDEVDFLEINEAFAAQVLGCLRELRLEADRINLRGGAIALGHPIGASGARVLTTLVHQLLDSPDEGCKGIASLCIGGGMGIAMAVEKL